MQIFVKLKIKIKIKKNKNKNKNKITSSEGLPFIPTRLFKHLSLKTIKNEKVFKIIESSGTGGDTSKIFLDKFNANLQTQILIKIFQDFFKIWCLILSSQITSQFPRSLDFIYE